MAASWVQSTQHRPARKLRATFPFLQPALSKHASSKRILGTDVVQRRVVVGGSSTAENCHFWSSSIFCSFCFVLETRQRQLVLHR